MLEHMEIVSYIGKMAATAEFLAHSANLLGLFRVRHRFDLFLLALFLLGVPLNLLLITVVPSLLVSEPVHGLSLGQLPSLIWFQ